MSGNEGVKRQRNSPCASLVFGIIKEQVPCAWNADFRAAAFAPVAHRCTEWWSLSPPSSSASILLPLSSLHLSLKVYYYAIRCCGCVLFVAKGGEEDTDCIITPDCV